MSFMPFHFVRLAMKANTIGNAINRQKPINGGDTKASPQQCSLKSALFIFFFAGFVLELLILFTSKW